MSHWTRIKLKMTDEETLVKALERMGCSNVQTGTKQISAYGQSDTANVWTDNGGVGFKKEKDGTYSMVGDFYHAQGKMRDYYNRNEQFQEDLNGAYGIEDTMAKVNALGLGFELTGNEQFEEDEEGVIRLEFTTYNELS